VAEKLLKFVSLAQAAPDKREAIDRRQDFGEIYRDYTPAAASAQASRCSQCGVPFCQVHCPLSNNIPDWLKLAAEDRLEEAYEISSATNSFPEICGRICPQDRLCEGNCVIEQAGHGAVTIGAIERHITDTAWVEGWVKPIRPRIELSQSIGIIGSGPAGLAAAEQLRQQGYQVTIYDRADRFGGLLIYGIPNFKLDKSIVDRRIRHLADAGIAFKGMIEIGREISFDQLRKQHDAVLIATGVYRARDIATPGAGLAGIVPALVYLTASNKLGLGDDASTIEGGTLQDGSLDAAGKNVVVIGGGDTAMDCVRTAIRQGARSVKCLYRRDRQNMPGSQREVRHAEEEGVEFVWQAAPEAFLDGTAGRIGVVRAHRIHLGLPDAGGRQTPRVIERSHFNLEADLVIKALGFDPEDLQTLFDVPQLSISKAGTLRIDPKTMMTNVPQVFAAGDIVRGASLVVWAILDGRDAAAAIHRHLSDSKPAVKAAE
jgi:glutamate synthase (NADPH/NADH) small chain